MNLEALVNHVNSLRSQFLVRSDDLFASFQRNLELNSKAQRLELLPESELTDFLQDRLQCWERAHAAMEDALYWLQKHHATVLKLRAELEKPNRGVQP
ncbi:MAG TPA: hypothetical protein VHS31_09060 [Tepidisphaeraceae bacterium]|jgi:hypothetical protein|nr:hypothetical protein [Tepidisphaeraceae bacterium]